MTKKPLFQLPNEFEIGIAELDLQHRQLESLLLRLRESGDKRYSYAANAILVELAIQMRIHHAVEKSLMRLLSFPETEAHVTDHRRMAEQLEKFRRRAEDFDVTDELTGFIQTWLVDHIDKFDREFVGHFLEKGIDPHAMPQPI